VSVQSLMSNLEKTYRLNESLLQLSTKKTDILKKGDFDALNELTANEQKHIQAIEQLEKQREKLLSELVKTSGNPTVTLSDCLELVNDTEREKLNEFKEKLTQQLKELQNRNDLNEQLIQQSLQFIQVSLNLFRPQQEQITYAPPNKQSSNGLEANSIFNRKA